ncbi:MAG TPA: tetratricopeptide repeat protein [Lacipirellulaceae bacterium]|nr:tetratricopeptide repeat protein [Lacipirellulaceae bacterium]
MSIAYPAIAPAAFTDRVRLAHGSEAGEITDTTPLAVTVNKGSIGSRTVAVNEIKQVQFEGEPSELSQARAHAGNGAYAKALQLLDKIDASGVQRDLIKQDIEFYKAFCAAKLALSGDGQILDAGRSLNSFVHEHPNNFHYLEAVEVMGDLLMADGRFESAEKQYAELAKAPWPDYKMRADVSVGRTLQAQNKHAEAIQKFDEALALADDSAVAQDQKLAATLGKAVSVAETGKVDEAVGTIEKVIRDADPQQKELQARAHVALGKCFEKAGKTKDALWAFLYVDIIYNTVPEVHAEALAHLIPLWKAVGQEERSRETREALQQRYPNSRWAKQQ